MRAYPELAAEFKRRQQGDLPADFTEKANAYIAEVAEKGDTISRKASQNSIEAMLACYQNYLVALPI